ncbi:hypothetical protein CRG98_002363 [Punica granatum]|uniref:Uncharacterized protein n=1 Tax=Punica granatum TaxID=22663 RepID=A0A2I0L968_PUNGR|nr:hypothetical protein CRG98_002363 [Punica granatum]
MVSNSYFPHSLVPIISQAPNTSIHTPFSSSPSPPTVNSPLIRLEALSLTHSSALNPHTGTAHYYMPSAPCRVRSSSLEKLARAAHQLNTNEPSAAEEAGQAMPPYPNVSHELELQAVGSPRGISFVKGPYPAFFIELHLFNGDKNKDGGCCRDCF